MKIPVLLAPLSLAVALTLSGCGSSGDSHHHDHDHDHDVAGAVRVLVGDADSLRLYNIKDGTLEATYPIAAVSGVTTTEDGRFGVINVRGDDQQFRFLDSGVWVLDHVDHVHLEVDPPTLLSFSVDASDNGTARPAHVVSRDGRVALVFDGEQGPPEKRTKAVIMRLSALETSSTPDLLVLDGNRHHGLALPAAENTVIMSVAEGVGTARTGVRIYDANGVEIAAFPQSCPGLHGYAVIGPHYLLGCHRTEGAGGVLRITHDPDPAHAGDRFTQAQIAYPEGTLYISNFAYHPESDWAVAPWGTEAMIRVDPEASALSETDILALPARQCGFAMRDDHGEDLLVLTADGMLHSVDVADWEVRSSIKVMEAALSPNCGTMPPVLRSVGGFAYLTRPATNDLIEIDLDEEEITKTIELTSTPVRMTLFRHPAGLVDYGDH